MKALGKRTAIGKKARFEVFKRDGFTCQYCGAKPPGVLLQVDHIVAVASGGRNDADNLVTSCQPCNIGKGARSLTVAPQSLADKAAEVAEREAQLLGFHAIMEAKRDRLDAEVWRVLEVLYGGNLERAPQDEYVGTLRFIERLGVHEVLGAADIALSRTRIRKPFKYFCGVCWGKVRDLEEAAS